MVEVRYNGRIGNRLFMYAAGRIIAEEMGYDLCAEPIEGFKGTEDPVRGEHHESPVQMLLPREHPKVADIVADKSRRKIVLKSYMQEYEHIKGRAEDIKRWFRIPEGKKANKDSVLVHVRLGDLATLGWAPSMTYFTDVIDQNFSGRKIVVATDEPGSRHLSALDKYNPTYAEGDHLEHFRLLTTASNLIIGTSTFSWWAAFLSEARVFAPLMKRGYYSFKPFRNENYMVEESRYSYIENVETIGVEAE